MQRRVKQESVIIANRTSPSPSLFLGNLSYKVKFINEAKAYLINRDLPRFRAITALLPGDVLADIRGTRSDILHG